MTFASPFGGTDVGRAWLGRLRMGGQASARAAGATAGAFFAVTSPFFVAGLTGAVTANWLEGTDVYLVVALAVGALTWLVTAQWCARRSAGWTRTQLDRWYGVVVPARYAPLPALERDERGYWWTGFSYHRSPRTAGVARFVHSTVRDPATRTDAAWWVLNPLSVLFFIGPAAALVIGGLVFALSMAVDPRTYGPVPAGHPVGYLISLTISASIVAVGLLLMPYGLRAHLDTACRLLAVGHRGTATQLRQRVEELTLTRADAVGSQAAELRRIERDLHDGAQARLVAIGMTLGTIEHLLETDPAAARELLAEARQSSAKALQELRDLVRGIHPPVLAERGLGDAVRALALDSRQPTEVTVAMPSRPEPSVEAAAYFCVSELLANAAKHSGARQVWVDILFRAGLLRVIVTDDGCGGAQPGRGTGLRGIERRLGTFDGTLALSSPQGGPTTITMELPCALSSQRTSTSFDKD